MVVAELQRLADASEAAVAKRYLRQQSLAAVIEDAWRHADAMSRLEATLRTTMRPSATGVRPSRS